MDLSWIAGNAGLIGMMLLAVALALTLWVTRHAMDDPDARAERYRDPFD